MSGKSTNSCNFNMHLLIIYLHAFIINIYFLLIKEEIIREIRKHFELNENENTALLKLVGSS